MADRPDKTRKGRAHLAGIAAAAGLGSSSSPSPGLLGHPHADGRAQSSSSGYSVWQIVRTENAPSRWALPGFAVFSSASPRWVSPRFTFLIPLLLALFRASRSLQGAHRQLTAASVQSWASSSAPPHAGCTTTSSRAIPFSFRPRRDQSLAGEQSRGDRLPPLSRFARGPGRNVARLDRPGRSGCWPAAEALGSFALLVEQARDYISANPGAWLSYSPARSATSGMPS